MIAWTTDELDRIDAADELEIASVRSDGTLRAPTTIWVVRLGVVPTRVVDTGEPPVTVWG
jgi:hypothetical protein